MDQISYSHLKLSSSACMCIKLSSYTARLALAGYNPFSCWQLPNEATGEGRQSRAGSLSKSTLKFLYAAMKVNTMTVPALPNQDSTCDATPRHSVVWITEGGDTSVQMHGNASDLFLVGYWGCRHQGPLLLRP